MIRFASKLSLAMKKTLMDSQVHIHTQKWGSMESEWRGYPSRYAVEKVCITKQVWECVSLVMYDNFAEVVDTISTVQDGEGFAALFRVESIVKILRKR